MQEFALPRGDLCPNTAAINSANHIDTASTVVVCDTDEQAIQGAKQLRLGARPSKFGKGLEVAVLKTGG